MHMKIPIPTPRGYDPHSQSPLLLKPIMDQCDSGYPPNGSYAYCCEDAKKDVELPQRVDPTAERKSSPQEK